MTIHIVIVDDNKMDRYVAKRVLTKFSEIGNIEEAVSGNSFLETYFSGEKGGQMGMPPICVLMDINMPGLSGFETIVEMEARITDGRGPPCVVVMMLTSSSNPEDKKTAECLQSVKGYSPKPLDSDGVKEIIRTYGLCYDIHPPASTT